MNNVIPRRMGIGSSFQLVCFDLICTISARRALRFIHTVLSPLLPGIIGGAIQMMDLVARLCDVQESDRCMISKRLSLYNRLIRTAISCFMACRVVPGRTGCRALFLLRTVVVEARKTLSLRYLLQFLFESKLEPPTNALLGVACLGRGSM